MINVGNKKILYTVVEFLSRFEELSRRGPFLIYINNIEKHLKCKALELSVKMRYPDYIHGGRSSFFNATYNKENLNKGLISDVKLAIINIENNLYIVRRFDDI